MGESIEYCAAGCGRSIALFEAVDLPWRCWTCEVDLTINLEHLRARMRTLASNLAIGAALCRAWIIGRDACACDVGASGHEWHPGMGCTPESIANREWSTEPHAFAGYGHDCTECGEGRCYYLHSQCPECYADLDGNEFHSPGCGRPPHTLRHAISEET